VKAPTQANSNPTQSTQISLIRTLVIVATTCCILLVLWMLKISQTDPYVKATLNLQGSKENGNILYKMNCVSCHGINAQGLVGPSLSGVSKNYSDKQIISQIVNGETPPMPSFQIEPEAMADLLAYIHSLN